MAAYTSSQSGNWSDPATWGGGGTPGDGDTASIGAHTVTVDVDTTVGTSPNDITTKVIDQTSASSVLAIADGVTLTVRGNHGGVHNSTASIGAGSVWEWDNSASAGTPVYRPINNGFGKWHFNGTSAIARAEMRAIVGQTFGFTAPLGLSVFTYHKFLRCSTSVIGVMTGGLTISDGLFDACAEINWATTATSGDWIFDRNVWRNSTGENSATLNFSNAAASGTRRISRNVFDKVFIYNGKSFAIERNYCASGMTCAAANTASRCVLNFFRQDGQLNAGNGAIFPFTFRRNYFVVENGTGNPHFVAAQATVADTYAEQNVFESWCPDLVDAGDCLLIITTGVSGGFKVVARNNLVLPGSSGVMSGCLLTMFNAASSAITEWYRNTGNVNNSEAPNTGKRGMFAVSEGNDGTAGHVAALKSNLAWATAAAQGYLGERVQGNVKDVITAANADYNWRHNTSDGDNGRGYEDRPASNTLWTAGDAAAAGVDANGGTGDPDFVDSTRNLATWTAARGYGSTNADGLAAIQADPSRTRDLIAYVFEGFKVANSLMRTAAHDGGVVGAANYHDSTRDTTRLGFHGAIVADTYGIAYTGDLPDALVPPVLTATSAGTAITLEWTAATGGVESYTYDVYRDAVLLASNQSSPYVDTTGAQGVEYTYLVRVTDGVDETADSNETTGVIPFRRAYRPKLISRENIFRDRVVEDVS